MLKGKKIIIGVTGGIAAYKAAELVRLLVREGASPMVAMTSNATRFVGPLTFEALSAHRVISDMWEKEGSTIDHISWAQTSDLIIISPATANFIGKMANGIADDFLSTMILAASSNILICPAMNDRMYENPVVKENLDKLRKRGIEILEPEEGQLACQSEGPGRLQDPSRIVEQAHFIVSPKDLLNLNILITAGPTHEPMDPVRYITNRSSGKMGYSLARVSRRRGASTILVSGPTCLNPPLGVDFIGVRTAEEMKEAVFEKYQDCDIIIKAAAVADYRPKEIAKNKIKKGMNSVKFELKKNTDILAELGKRKPRFKYILVGFAAETEDLLSNAMEKLRRKGLDMIVANDVSRDDSGFETDTNAVKIICGEEKVYEIPLTSKDQVAENVLNRARELFQARGK